MPEDLLELLAHNDMSNPESACAYETAIRAQNVATYDRVDCYLRDFNKVFGNRRVGDIRPVDLEGYQERRESEGNAPATIDLTLAIVGGMVRKAWDNDMVDGRVVKAFK